MRRVVARLISVGLLLPGWALSGAATATAEPPTPQPACPSPCLNADADGFTAGATETFSGDGEGAGADSSAGGPSVKPTVIWQKTYVPTCSGNTAYNNGSLCGAAVQSCPIEGEVQFWVFTRRFNVVTGTEVTPYAREYEPPTVCLRPDDPVVEPTVAIPAIVQRDFKRVVVLKGNAEVSPRPDTLVNVPTRFRTDAPASYDIPLSILGQSVVITARAEQYTWYFGDGDSAVSYAPGGALEHVYRRAVTEQAYVVITWSGTYTVNGGASQPIAGTVSTTGTPAEVAVRQARSELVRN